MRKTILNAMVKMADACIAARRIGIKAAVVATVVLFSMNVISGVI